MSKPIVVGMMGLPRSGKSTKVKELTEATGAPIVSKDCIRLALHGQRYEPAAEGFVRAINQVMLRSLILAGHKLVIVDETHYSRAARDLIKDPRWRTVFYEVVTDPIVCKQRAIETNQEDLVPVIDEMVARYEPLGDDEERLLE